MPEWGATLTGFVLFILIVLLTGWIASGLIGKLTLGWIDKILQRVPFVKSIYGSARQLTDAVFVSRSSLRRTIIAEYPRVGMFAIGFLTSDDRIALADGRIFTGRQAKEAKLVDELGNLDDAIQLAAELAGIEGEPKVVEPRRRFSLRDLIESRLSVLFPKLDFYSGVSLKYLMAF